VGARDVIDAPTADETAATSAVANEKQSATCGCIFLVVILGVVIALSFWACKACGNKEAPPASQVTSGATASSSTSAVAVSTSPTPSETTSPSPVTSPSPSPTAQYAIDELTGFWVTYTGTDITLRARKNGDSLSAVLNVAPRPQVYLKPLRVSADTFRGKASTLTKDYVYLHFRDPNVLVIWFTAADGSKVRGTLHRNTIEPSDNGANYVGPSASGGNYADGGGQSAGQTYTLAQYAQLTPGMTYTQVDAIMGGGGIMVAQEGVWSTLLYQNIDAAGSQIKCTFEYDILIECSQAGL
jgi:hypothetical protein